MAPPTVLVLEMRKAKALSSKDTLPRYFQHSSERRGQRMLRAAVQVCDFGFRVAPTIPLASR